MDALDFVVEFAMDLFLTCKSKTLGQYCGGCISKLLCMSCLPYMMYGLDFGVNFAIALFLICKAKTKVRFCYRICDGWPYHV